MITRYMAQEMTSNCQYACSRWGSWDTRDGVTNSLILASFGWKVRNGAPWDHKQKIRNLTLSYESGFYTPLAGLDAAIYFDVCLARRSGPDRWHSSHAVRARR